MTPNTGSERRQRRSTSRRSALKRLATAATIGVGSLGIVQGPSLVGPVRGETGGAEEVEKTDEEIPSFDGTSLALSLYEPASGDSQPAVIVAQGGVSPRSSVDQRARALASEGYVALTFDPRGVGESGGKLRFGGSRDVKDISALLDHLADTASVRMDGSDEPRVGIEGTSAGGWRGLRAASDDDRIDGLTCLVTPYDAATSIGRDGVLKWPWTYFVYRAVRIPSVNPTDEFLELTQEAVDSKEPPEELLKFFEERSPKAGLERVDAPTLVLNGWHDRAFPPRDSLALYRELTAAAEKRLAMLDLGHDLEGAPFNETQYAFVSEVRRDWLAKHLRDEEPSDGSRLNEPPVHFYQAQSDTFEAYETLPDGERSFPLREGTGEGATRLELDGDENDRRAEFDFPVDADLELAGVGRISLHATPTDGDPHLFAALQDVPPEESDAEPTHIKDQVTATELTEPGAVSFELNGVQRTVEEGHTLRLVLTLNDDELAGFRALPGRLFSDGLYVDTEPPAALTVHHSRGRDSTLRVTTTEDG